MCFIMKFCFHSFINNTWTRQLFTEIEALMISDVLISNDYRANIEAGNKRRAQCQPLPLHFIQSELWM